MRDHPHGGHLPSADVFSVSTLRRLALVGLLFAAACSSGDDGQAPIGTATSLLEPAVTQPAPTTIVLSTETSVPVTSAPEISAEPPVTTDVAGSGNITCDALVDLAADVNDEALATLISVVVEDNELLLPAAVQVLSDADAGSTARLLAAGRLAELVGATECDLAPPADRVFVDATGLWIGSIGETPVLVAPFGITRSAAVSPITLVLGSPIVDTGPIDPFSVYGTCGGAQLWAVEWPGLVLLFSDDGEGPQSFELATWRVYRQEGVTALDEGLPTTVTGLGLGSTLDEVLDVFPDGDRFFDELAFGEAVSVDDQLWFIAGDEADVVTFIEAGFLCGE